MYIPLRFISNLRIIFFNLLYLGVCIGIFHKYTVHIQQDMCFSPLNAVHFKGGPSVPGCFISVFFPFGIFCVRGDRVKENKQAEC